MVKSQITGKNIGIISPTDPIFKKTCAAGDFMFGSKNAYLVIIE